MQEALRIFGEGLAEMQGAIQTFGEGSADKKGTGKSLREGSADKKEAVLTFGEGISEQRGVPRDCQSRNLMLNKKVSRDFVILVFFNNIKIRRLKMQYENNKVNFTGQDIFIGMDVHKKQWAISIYVGEIEHKRYIQPPRVEILKNYVTKMFPGGSYYSVYEAGYCGFWIHRELQRAGIKNIVVNPADIPTNNKEKRRKTDKVDSKKLAQRLVQKQLKGIYVPDEESDCDRRLGKTK